uniref:Uncharacterized protein n=1 Tax=uncultured marine crenarchaeote HF4000_ANIW141M12 TaxID=455578 RepID=B3T5Y4_9ARCH|nr:hypothetical protein ALOHA_HF4000ANIW141M12ctg1g44 [uncultured marine crenarchaeote HF4000_ANIW141M12]
MYILTPTIDALHQSYMRLVTPCQMILNLYQALLIRSRFSLFAKKLSNNN